MVEKDTHLTSVQDLDANLGARPTLQFFQSNDLKYRPLLEADLSGVNAPGTDIAQATLELYHAGQVLGVQDMTIEIYALSTPWTEGTGVLNNQTGDGASWLYADTSSQTAWNTLGGDFNTTFDFGNGPNGVVLQTTIPAAAIGTSYGWMQFDVTPAVQAWTDGALPNYGLGFVITSGNFTEHQFYSSEAPQTDLHPRLQVEINEPVSEPVVTFGRNLVVNGSFEKLADNDGGRHGKHATSDAVFAEWDVTQDGGPELNTVSSGDGPAAHGGAYVELDGDANSGIAQDIETVAGISYQLSFERRSTPGVSADSNGIDVYWNGTLVASLSADGDATNNWRTETFTVTASGETSRLEFRASGTSDGRGLLLDNVAVREIRDGGQPSYADLRRRHHGRRHDD